MKSIEKKSLWEKSIHSFTMFDTTDNPNIRELKTEEGFSAKLILSLQKAKVKSTEQCRKSFLCF